jgi:hypothetical protein
LYGVLFLLKIVFSACMVLQVVERQRCGVVFMPGSRMAGVVIVYERDYFFYCLSLSAMLGTLFLSPRHNGTSILCGALYNEFHLFLGFVFVVLC